MVELKSERIEDLLLAQKATFNIQSQLERIESLLLSQKTIFNLRELCDYTGLSKSTVYKLTAERAVPCYCPNGKILFFKKSEVDKWLLSNPIATATDIEQEANNRLAELKAKGGLNGL